MSNPLSQNDTQANGQPLLAFIDADIVSSKDEIAREALLKNLRRHRDSGVSPLWVNWLRQRAGQDKLFHQT